jgi:transcriptional regulator with XRE-family HTH domain
MAVTPRPVTILRFDRFRMRRLREAKGLSRDALAALCPNVSAAAIRTYEAGGHVPDVDRALQIARALGVTVEKLSAPTIEGAPRDPVHPEGAEARGE